MSVDWDEGMSVGVEKLDAGHRHIMRCARRLVDGITGGSADDIRAGLRFLHSAVAEVHADEEEWMADAGYPGAGEHTRTHAAIRERLAAARAGDAEASVARLTEAAAEVLELLDGHMRRDDLKLGRFWIARENLRRLAEDGPGVGASLTPIPGSVAAFTPVRRPALAPTRTEAPPGTTPGPGTGGGRGRGV